MTESEYAEIERRVIATPARPVTEAPALDADLRQRETVQALEQACMSHGVPHESRTTAISRCHDWTTVSGPRHHDGSLPNPATPCFSL